MFRFKDVKYKDILYVKELHIKDRKVTTLFGESGCGKTTCLKLLNKLISFDDGDILYKDTSLKDENSILLRREVVMLPQSPIIYEGSVKDNLLIGLKFSEKEEASVEEMKKILMQVNFSKDLEDDAEKLSGGEKQRLAIGRVLLMKPKVLLLDEPSSALDENTEEIIFDLVVKYAKENKKTLIMVTHSKKIAYKYSDYIVNIKNGAVKDCVEVNDARGS